MGGASYFNNTTHTVEPYFINAKYWISEKQWNNAHFPNKREAASYFMDNLNVLEKEDKLNLIKSDSYQLTPNILLEEKNGHTFGLMIVYIKYKEHTLVYTADFIPSYAHIPIPYIASFDIEPLLVMKEKEEFLIKAIENSYIIIFEHDPLYECCKVVKTEKGFKNGDALFISEL